CLGPRPRSLVTQKRHGRDVVWAMAGLAVPLKDGQNVLIEGHGLRGQRLGAEYVASEQKPGRPESFVHNVLPVRPEFPELTTAWLILRSFWKCKIHFTGQIDTFFE